MRLLIILFTIFLYPPELTFSSEFKEGFYKLGKSRIDIRCLIQDDTSAFLELPSLDGKTYNLCNSILIDTSDFEGVDIANNNLQFYLKKEAWKKSRNITKKYLNQTIWGDIPTGSPYPTIESIQLLTARWFFHTKIAARITRKKA